MVRHDKPIGACEKCQGERLICRFNRFESDEVRILSWEHRCGDCGERQTRAYRSDEPDEALEQVDTEVCPFCGRSAE